MEKKKYPWTRQRLISAVILFTFLLFPVVINFLSPYIIIDGAFQGIITGSFILFVLLFISSLFLGRLWYSWVCPAAELQEAFFAANNKPVKGKRIDWIKWVIWVLWIEVIVLGVITAGGLTKIAPLHFRIECIRYFPYFPIVPCRLHPDSLCKLVYTFYN